VRYVPNRETGGTTCVDVPEDEATRPCLDDETATQLAEYGVRLERHYGAAQDVEWALTRRADGTAPSPREGSAPLALPRRETSKIVLLQSRPISTGRTKEPIATPLPSQTDYVVQQLLATSKKKIEL